MGVSQIVPGHHGQPVLVVRTIGAVIVQVLIGGEPAFVLDIRPASQSRGHLCYVAAGVKRNFHREIVVTFRYERDAAFRLLWQWHHNLACAARAKVLTPERRSEIARLAAEARWKKSES